jgi:hypothetical protein
VTSTAMSLSVTNPDRDVTTTSKWTKLSNNHLATPAEKVLMNNLEIIASQNRAILKGQENIASLLEKYDLFVVKIAIEYSRLVQTPAYKGHSKR